MRKQHSDPTQSDRWQCIAAVWRGVFWTSIILPWIGFK